MRKPGKERRSFTPEFKQEAVRLWDERRGTGVPMSRVARELGIRPNQLREWIAQHAATTTAPSATGETLQQELRRLRRENARLKEEAAFAKKAAAFFARESQ